jgi:hypothetical protein
MSNGRWRLRQLTAPNSTIWVANKLGGICGNACPGVCLRFYFGLAWRFEPHPSAYKTAMQPTTPHKPRAVVQLDTSPKIFNPSKICHYSFYEILLFVALPLNNLVWRHAHMLDLSGGVSMPLLLRAPVCRGDRRVMQNRRLSRGLTHYWAKL